MLVIPVKTLSAYGVHELSYRIGFESLLRVLYSFE
jgi:hypothetical protein